MKQTNVFLLVNPARVSGRGVLQGVLKYAAQCPGWTLHICNLYDNGCEQICSALKEGRIDGLITSELDDGPLTSLLEESDRPLIVTGTRRICLAARTVNMAVVTSDESALGATAARHLLYLGRSKSFGFVPIREPVYRYLCDLRKAGFSSELEKAGISTVVYEPPDDDDATDEKALEDWIVNLEKPAALCVGCDRRAVDVVNACARRGIRIPEEVRILGIDNDEFFCLSTKPQLSSLQRDCTAEGYAAAEQLDKLLRQKRASKRRELICRYPYQLVTRGTTSVLPPGLELVRRARELIRLNLSDGLTTEKVAKCLHVSQRLLFLRFREFSDKSIQETINGERIRVIKQLLSKGRMTHAAIAERTGLASATSLRRLFRRQEGKSIRRWQRERLQSDSIAKPIT